MIERLAAPVVQPLGSCFVLRDDLLRGGTKRRALPALMGSGDEFVYASPVQGYAQIAVAVTATALGKRATIFCAERRERHANTVEAECAGAKIVQVAPGYLSVVRARAREYCEQTGALMLPFGLDAPAFIGQLALVARALPEPPEVWCAAGSGVLSRALQLAWTDAAHVAVRVGAAPDVGRARLLVAPERFECPARVPPPFSSCPNYDAKVWRFFREQAVAGALFWNVAG